MLRYISKWRFLLNIVSFILLILCINLSNPCFFVDSRFIYPENCHFKMYGVDLGLFSIPWYIILSVIIIFAVIYIATSIVIYYDIIKHKRKPELIIMLAISLVLLLTSFFNVCRYEYLVKNEATVFADVPEREFYLVKTNPITNTATFFDTSKNINVVLYTNPRGIRYLNEWKKREFAFFLVYDCNMVFKDIKSIEVMWPVYSNAHLPIYRTKLQPIEDIIR